MARRKHTTGDSSRRFRAVGYVRVSREEQLDGYSIDAQRKAIRERSDRDDREFLRFYADEGVSAFEGNSQNRPAFNEMMEDARAGKFDVLIVDRMDRFGRDSSHSIQTLKELLYLKIEFVSIKEETNINDPTGMFTAEIYTLMAEKYSLDISYAVNKAINAKREQGKAWTRGPYGYQLCNKTCPVNDQHPYWHLHEVKAPLAKRIFELYDSGTHSTAAIAAWLNDRGHRTNGQSVDKPGASIKGNLFTSHSVSSILKNHSYIGFLNDPESETGKRIGQHAPIVDKGLFDRVQRRLRKNAGSRVNAGAKNKEPSVLARIARCYMCGSLYHSVKQGKSPYHYLRMKKKGRSPACICVGRSFTAKYVARDLDILFQGFTLNESWRVQLLEALGHDPDAEEIEKERKRLHEKMRRNGDLYEDMLIDRTTYKARIAQLETALASLQPPKGASVVEAAEYLLENLGPFWNNATNEEKNEMLLRIFDRIYVDIETKRIHSLVSKEEFAMPFRAMAERDDVKLEEIAQQDSRELVDRRGFAYQFATNLLRIVFPSELAIAGLAERIKDRRHEWCMSRVELAERLGVSASKIGSWENGSTPSFEMLEVLADWFSEEPPRWAISMSEMPSAGQRIKKHRLAWGMSQSELGERLGVSVAAIGSWERGGSPSIHKLKLLTGWMAEKPPARRAREAVNAELGKRIKQKRLKIAMSQAALGKHLGVDKNQIRHWENAVNSPSKRYAAMLEKWLDEPSDGIFAQRIRNKRAELGLTQKDLAAVLDVSLIAVKSWENRRTLPSSKNLSRVIKWLSRGHIHHRKPEKQPEFTLFVLPMKEKRERLRIGTMMLALHLGVGKNRVREWETGRSVPSEAGCRKIGNWLQAA